MSSKNSKVNTSNKSMSKNNNKLGDVKDLYVYSYKLFGEYYEKKAGKNEIKMRLEIPNEDNEKRNTFHVVNGITVKTFTKEKLVNVIIQTTMYEVTLFGTYIKKTFPDDIYGYFKLFGTNSSARDIQKSNSGRNVYIKSITAAELPNEFAEVNY